VVGAVQHIELWQELSSILHTVLHEVRKRKNLIRAGIPVTINMVTHARHRAQSKRDSTSPAQLTIRQLSAFNFRDHQQGIAPASTIVTQGALIQSIVLKNVKLKES
jgi:hypothetical protein